MRIIVKYRGYAFRALLQFFLVDIWVTMGNELLDAQRDKHVQSCGTVIKVRFTTVVTTSQAAEQRLNKSPVSRSIGVKQASASSREV
jgi:hypothetical protein